MGLGRLDQQKIYAIIDVDIENNREYSRSKPGKEHQLYGYAPTKMGSLTDLIMLPMEEL